LCAVEEMDWSGRASALLAAVADALKDDDAGVRLVAARVVGRLSARTKDSAALSAGMEALVGRLEDPDTAVRAAAASALCGMGRLAAPAVPALIRALEREHENLEVWLEAIEALGAIGLVRHEVLDAVREVLIVLEEDSSSPIVLIAGMFDGSSEPPVTAARVREAGLATLEKLGAPAE
jgi:HEAT repeat protein